MRYVLIVMSLIIAGCSPKKQHEMPKEEAKNEVQQEAVVDLPDYIQLFQKGDYKEAFNKINTRATMGDGEAIFWQGIYAREGFGQVPVNFKKAALYFKQSGANGYALGKVAHQIILVNLGEIKGSETFWINLLKQTKAYQPKGVVAYYQGTIMKYLKSYGEAGDFLKAAILEYPPAKGMLYQFYDHGLLNDKKIEVELFKQLETLAEGGVASAQLVLGVSYRNSPEGIAWLKKCQKQGLIACYSVLGFNYINGKGVPMDREKGYKLLNEAAKKGDLNLKADLKKAGFFEE